MRPIPATPSLAVITASLVLLSACGPGAIHGQLVVTLCTAAAAARSGDQTGARHLFVDRAHQPIHQLTSATSKLDRAASAKLLEAKQQVGDDLSTPGTSGLTEHLIVLAATWQAAGRVDGQPEALLATDDSLVVAVASQDDRTAIYQSADAGRTWQLRYRNQV